MKKFLLISIISLMVLMVLTGCGGGGSGVTTYTVTYDANGSDDGSVPVDSAKYQQGQTVTVLGNTGNLAKTGFVFAGWNTQADGNGTTYTQGQTFTIGTANVTLYAKWTTNPTYTVTYDGNSNTGGSVPVDSTNYEQGQTVTILGNLGNLTKTGSFFAGWNTRADGSGTTYTQSQTFTMGAANVTLYAKWTANPTYSVIYNANGPTTSGFLPTDNTKYQQGQTVTVLGNPGNLAKTGYIFSGWNTLANGNGTTYTQGQTFTMGAANVTLYAKWMTPAGTYLLQYCSDVNPTRWARTTSGIYEMTARFTPDELGAYQGGKVTEIHFNASGTICTIKLYGHGTPDAPGPLLYQTTSNPTFSGWHTIAIPAGQQPTVGPGDLWISYEKDYTGFDATEKGLGVDTKTYDQKPNGSWHRWNGGAWSKKDDALWKLRMQVKME